MEKINKEILKNRFKDLILKNPDGFTSNKNGILLNLNKGYSVSITNNLNKNPDVLIEDLFKLIKKHKVVFYNVGGWYSEKDKLYFLDISFYTNKLNRAVNIGLKNKQQAIFDFKEMRCINLN